MPFVRALMCADSLLHNHKRPSCEAARFLKGGDRISAKPDAQFSEGKAAQGFAFEIDDSVKLQKIDGFGASIMEAGLMT